MAAGAFVAVLCVLLANVDISQQQVFLSQIDNQIVAEGTDILLSLVLAPSIPESGIWYKDNQVIGNVQNKTTIFVFNQLRTLFIQNVSPSDTGTYAFSVRGVNSSFTFTSINIQFSTSLPPTTAANVGSNVLLQATLSLANIQAGFWYREGVLVNNARYQSSVDGFNQRLLISNAQTSDSGNFEYRVYNLRTATILTVSSPVFLTRIRDQTVAQGTNILLSLQVFPTITDPGIWYKDNAVIVDTPFDRINITASNQIRSLFIQNVSPADTGNYALSIQGVNDTFSFNAINIQFSVFLPPTTAANVGSNVLLQATLSLANIQAGFWYKDGVLVNNARYQSSVDGFNQRLLISNAQTSDSGNYEYRVYNLRTSTALTVGPAGLFVVNGLQDIREFENSTVTFQTTLSQIPSQPGQWYRNNTLIVPGGKFIPFRDANIEYLSIFLPTTSDTGLYEYRNGDISTSAFLTIVIPQNLFIQNGLQNTTVPVGNDATFQLQLSVPNVDFGVWQKEQVVLQNNSKTLISFLGEFQQLRITSVTLNDAGTYSYTVNGLRTFGILNVEQGLSISLGLRNITVLTGSTVRFTATLSLRGIGTGTWSVNGTDLVNTTRTEIFVDGDIQTLTLYDVTVADIGRYRYAVSGLSTDGYLNVIPINGNWGVWSSWSTNTCDNTCGNGNDVTQIRVRACDNPPASPGGLPCPGFGQQNRTLLCEFGPCPVNGNWGGWSLWSTNTCDNTCGNGNDVIQIRVRACDNPPASPGGLPCPGFGQQNRTLLCEFDPCAVDGRWTLWTDWAVSGNCSVTCGIGNQLYNRSRTCIEPQFGGNVCVGPTAQSEFRPCTRGGCPVDGRWTLWGPWIRITPCSASCGLGLVNRTRARICIQPTNGGQECIGSPTEMDQANCTLIICPIDGIYTPWTQWALADVCSVTCGVGTERLRRNRTCIEPQFGGNECVGSNVDFRPRLCNRTQCPVDGVWRAWSQWSSTPCSVTCGIGLQTTTRSRTCVEPQAGGQPCVGSPTQSFNSSCNPRVCEIDGVWRPWGVWQPFTICSRTCGGGSRNYTRSRICVPPQFGGQPCVGNSTEYETRSCNTNNCPIDGIWRPWTQWAATSICSATCGLGTRNLQRVRICIPPLFNGTDCQGSSTDVRQENCTRTNCPINGNWGGWSLWSAFDCGITCGSRNDVFRNRTRVCNNPAPRFGGQTCLGPASQRASATCSFPSCVVDLCTNARVIGGVGYRYHPTDCDKYIQCYYNPNGGLVASFRTCPFGQFWDQQTIRCQESYKVDCPLDQCKDDCHYNSNMLGSCRAHWQCDRNKVARPKCCGMGFSYVDGQGCQPNFYCRDNCPTACVDRDVCDKHPDWGNTNAYNLSVGLIGWLRSSCVSGTFFDIVDCGCSLANASCQASYDLSFNSGNLLNIALSSWLSRSNVDVISGYGNFGGNSQLTADIKMPQASRGCPLIIRFRYREAVGVTGRHVLLSTSDCRRGNSLVIAVNDIDMMFELTSWYGWTVKLPVRLTGFPRTDFKTVTLMYSGYDMLVSIESTRLKYTARVMATESTIMACGLMFGTDGINTSENFRGQLDRLTIYKCNPGRLY